MSQLRPEAKVPEPSRTEVEPPFAFPDMQMDDGRFSDTSRNQLYARIIASRNGLELGKALRGVEIAAVIDASDPEASCFVLDSYLSVVSRLLIHDSVDAHVPALVASYLTSLAGDIDSQRLRSEQNDAYELITKLQHEIEEVGSVLEVDLREMITTTLARLHAWYQEASSYDLMTAKSTPAMSQRYELSDGTMRTPLIADALDDLAVVLGVAKSLLSEQIPKSSPDATSQSFVDDLQKLGEIVDKYQYRLMGLFVTSTLLTQLSTVVSLITTLEDTAPDMSVVSSSEEREVPSDREMLTSFCNALLSLSDWSLAALRDIEYSEHVKTTHRTKVQEYLSSLYSTLEIVGFDIEDETSATQLAVLQAAIHQELRKVRGEIDEHGHKRTFGPKPPGDS